MKLSWVWRNEDKPHRCPKCHCVAQWHHDGYDHYRDRRHGPRTRVWCPYCRVQWRMGNRATGKSTMWYRRWNGGGMLREPNDVTFTWDTRVGRRRRGGRPS